MPDRARRRIVIDKRTLRAALALFLLALIVPTALFIGYAYEQLKRESYFQHRVQAEGFAKRIDARLAEIIATEKARPREDYEFVTRGPKAQIPQRSPLADTTAPAVMPGLVGYFQIDSHGVFSTPLLPADGDPAAYGIDATEAAKRRAIQERVRRLLVAAAPTPAAPSRQPVAELAAAQRASENQHNQAAFTRLDEATGKVAAHDQTAGINGAAYKAYVQPSAPMREVARTSVQIFDEPDPFVLLTLDASHFVLFRKVILNNGRVVQGAVIDQHQFLRATVDQPFRDSTLAPVSRLAVGYQNRVIESVGPQARAAEVASGDEQLLRTPLSGPFSDFELIFTASQLPLGPSVRVVGWLTIAFGFVLFAGCWALYRVGLRQIELTAQQQDFVAAVSHEFKTPLTSIRMYGEMLRAGWADESKKQQYYDFIYHESERLARLIDNVLRFARTPGNGDDLERRPHTTGELLGLVESRVAAQVDRAGFVLHIDRGDGTSIIDLDSDAFVQILINLVDNALKFSARAARKEVELGVRAVPGGRVQFSVRDYGPGVSTGQMHHIFEPFYRGQNELTRETAGTGIGLALVDELTRAMGGSVEVHNRHPGAEFIVSFPVAQ